MGVYRSVFCRMSCEHCGRHHRAEVQFETGDDRQEEYDDGQRISQDGGLAPGGSHDGVVNRFCPDCDRNWRAAHAAAMCDALASFVEQGRLRLKAKNSSTDHAPGELRRRGLAARDNILRGLDGGNATIAFAFLELSWDGETVDFMDSASEPAMAFTNHFHGAVEDGLKAAGWPLGRDSLREDLRVRIGKDGIISVQGADGAPMR